MTKAVPKAYICARLTSDGSKVVETVGRVYSRKHYCQLLCDSVNRYHGKLTGFHYVVCVADNWQPIEC